MLSIEIVEAQKYNEIIKESKYFYNCSQFQELNKYKVDRVVYMLFKRNRYTMGIVGGINNGNLMFPYSAPFSMFEFRSANVSLEDIYHAILLIEDYAVVEKVESILFQLPPFIYDETNISKVHNSLLYMGYKNIVCDLNYYYIIKNMNYFEKSLHRNACKNLKTAKQKGFEFIWCHTEKERKRAYEVIKTNREEKGRILKLNYEQVEETIKLTAYDFFLLKLEKVDVAAAIVFQIKKEIYQVIYWGDISGYSHCRPMNFLSAKLYEYYLEKGIRILDIGPSTEQGIPNFGLCSFKESIGCKVSTKYSFQKQLK